MAPTELGVFRRIVVPLSGPAITTVAVLTFLFSWNLFLWPLAIMSSQANFTAPLGLSLLGLGSTFRPDYESGWPRRSSRCCRRSSSS